MEQCFHLILIFIILSISQLTDSKFQYDDLSRIDWKNFTDNFLFVRGASHSGSHWLDDKAWLRIVVNTKKVSKRHYKFHKRKKQALILNIIIAILHRIPGYLSLPGKIIFLTRKWVITSEKEENNLCRLCKHKVVGYLNSRYKNELILFEEADTKVVEWVNRF